MTKEQAQIFVNDVERQIMDYARENNHLDKIEDLEEALNEFDKSMMRIMELISE
jgi:cell division septum initiation protein DivIVA